MDGSGDTIVAVATPWGEGGIGVVRLSGGEALAIAGRVFAGVRGERVEEAPTHVVRYGQVRDPRSGEVIDEAILLVMRGPRSYTREDVAEIQCHGGRVAVAKVLGALLAAGARMAEPGEFTRRAFLNGRIDLVQAEAVLQLVRARGEPEHRTAVAALRGQTREWVGGLARGVWNMLVQTEGALNFPEEVEPPEAAELVALAGEGRKLAAQVGWAAGREGFRVVLVGRPNAGKSSLLNTLLGYPRAIVSAEAGTTRDTVEEVYRAGDLGIVLVDTAGLGQASGELERLGMERTVAALEEADLLLMVIDGSRPLGEAEWELFRLCAGKAALVILNKTDLGVTGDLAREVERETGYRTLAVSALTGEGMAAVEAALLETGAEREREAPGMLATERQRGCLARAVGALEGLAEAANRGQIPVEVWPIELREAWEALGEITGETASPDLLQEIFDRFCLGK